MTEKQTPAFVATLVAHMNCFNALLTADADWVLKGNQKEVIGVCVAAIKKYRLLKIFKPIFTDRVLTIKALNGQRNIFDAKEAFKAGIDPDFKNFGLNKQGKPTNEIHPAIYELQEDFQFSDDNWDKFSTQDQIIEFCVTLPGLLSRGAFTLFPLEESGKHFVARVFVSSVGLDVSVYRFEHDFLWRAGYRRRLVVPQPLFF